MKSNWPRISIVTPSFNQARFLGQTIESVLGQNYPNLEYWVIDGGSSDGSVEILQRYGKRVRWISEKDDGQSAAINKGLRRSTGEIMAYLNSDDVLARGALRRAALAFARHPNRQWLTGDCLIINESGAPRDRLVAAYKRFFRRWLSLPLTGRYLMGILNPIAQPATFWRRSAGKAIGEFRVDLRYTMDYDYWLRLWRLGPPLVLPATLAGFRVHGASKGGTGFKKQFAEQLAVAKAAGYPGWILNLQKLHNYLIASAYSRR